MYDAVKGNTIKVRKNKKEKNEREGRKEKEKIKGN